MKVRKQIIDLEKRFWRAAGNPDFYRSKFAEEGVMAFPVGLMGKAEVLAAMDGEAGWDSFTMDDLRFVQVTDDVASLSYTTVAMPAGSTEGYRAAVTSVYVRRRGEWFLILHQQTPL